MGIHIPDRDAAWELEPGAFSELYQRYQHCDPPPSVCMNKAETALRTKGGGVSFCVRHVDPTEPTGTAPLLDPTARNGSVMSVCLLQPWILYLKT